MRKRLVLLFCAFAFCFIASPASAKTPENHEEYMKNESYENAFNQFTLGMEEARERLTPDEYAALEKAGGEVIAGWARQGMEEYGFSEAEAYESAYWSRYEYVNRELRKDWLRKNAEDAQGFYRLKSDSFDGYMTLEKGDEEGLYAVEIEVAMKSDPDNTGSFYGPGRLSGNTMTVAHDDDDNAITITFDGEKAKVTTSQALKDSGWFSEGLTIDGEYLREKK